MASPFSELLITGKEREFFSTFAFGDFVFDKEAFSQAAIDQYIADQARPGRLKAGLAYYRALLAGKDFFETTVAPPWTFPVLAIDGDQSMKGLTSKSFERVAPKLKSVIAPDCGHFVQEEQPEFLVKTLWIFFRRCSDVFRLHVWLEGLIISVVKWFRLRLRFLSWESC